MTQKKESPLHSRLSSKLFDPEVESKDTLIDSDIQLRRVRNALKNEPMTMREVEAVTGIERSSVCWYIGKLRDRGQVELHHIGVCKTTGFTVNYYTCDPQLFTNEERGV